MISTDSISPGSLGTPSDPYTEARDRRGATYTERPDGWTFLPCCPGHAIPIRYIDGLPSYDRDRA